MHWLSHFFGLDNLSGPWYGFWSGVGSDISEVAIIGGVIQIYRKHNCGIRGCWRMGRRQVPGTDHVVCNRHHPRQAPTHAEVLADHQDALQLPRERT